MAENRQDGEADRLRKSLQSQRKSLSEVDRQALAARLDSQFVQLLQDELRPLPGSCWGMHRPLVWEWELPETRKFLLRCGVRLVYPRIHNAHDATQGMSWHEASEDVPAQWKANRQIPALLEPIESLAVIDPATLAGIWVPGVAFSVRGERMGTGGGFYDIFLARFPQAIRVAAAAGFQLFPELPGQRPDEPRMDWIVGESRVWKPGRK